MNGTSTTLLENQARAKSLRNMWPINLLRNVNRFTGGGLPEVCLNFFRTTCDPQKPDACVATDPRQLKRISKHPLRVAMWPEHNNI